jgi:hypothetical protein
MALFHVLAEVQDLDLLALRPKVARGMTAAFQ